MASQCNLRHIMAVLLALMAGAGHAYPRNPLDHILLGAEPQAGAAALIKSVQPSPGSDQWAPNLDNTYLTPKYLSLFLDLGSGQALIDSQNARAELWNTTVGIKKLITSGTTEAPVALPPRFKTGDLLDTTAQFTKLYYMFWQGVESARHLYFLCVADRQVLTLVREGVQGITASPPYGPQFVRLPQPPGACRRNINAFLTPKSGGYGNGVTEYALSYLDLSGGPVELGFPEIPTGTYWLVVIYNFYGEVVETFGTRKGTQQGKYVILPPGYKMTDALKATYPASQQVNLGGLDGIIISRILDDRNYAVNYTLGPVAGGKNVTTTYWWGIDPSVFNVYNQYEPLYFWKLAALVNARNPRPGLYTSQKELLKRMGFSTDKGLDTSATTTDEKRAMVAAIAYGNQGLAESFYYIGPQSQNYWYVTSWNSQKATEYAKNGAYFKGFWIANIIQDAAYILQFLDSTATPLNGQNLYNISFPATALPPTNGAFWSLQVMRLDEINLANVLSPLKTRSTSFCGYVYGDKISSTSTSLTKNPDGGVTIMLTAAPKPDDFTEGNWLQAPAAVPLYLVLRVYNPFYPDVLTYSPPAVVRME